MPAARCGTLLLHAAAAAASPASAPRRNVLHLIVDDMRTQLNKAYGQSFMITPNLDKLAETGTVFDHAYVQYAWCSPSRNSFMTGRYPDTLQIWNFGKNFRTTPQNPPTGGGSPDLSVTPIPEYFKQHGYLSVGGGKVYHPQQPPNNDVPHSWSADIPYFNFHNQLCPGDKTLIHNCSGCPQDLPDEHFYDWKLANHTIYSLRHAKAAGQNFYIAAGFRRPHVPWYIAQRFTDMYPDTVPPPRFPGWAVGQPRCAFVCGGDAGTCDWNITDPRPAKEASTCRKTYYAAITSTDHYVGLVLDELDALGLASNTAVLIYGDHGWHLGEGNQWAKYTNLEFATRTPFILRAPWIKGPGRVSAIAEAVDVYPTLAELAGLPPPPQAEGVSQVPALSGGVAPRDSAVSQMAHCCDKPPHSPVNSSHCQLCGTEPSTNITYMGYAVRTAEWRYVEWHMFDDAHLRPQCSGLIGSELYPHTGDDGLSFDSAYEHTNQFGPHADVQADMHTLLFKRFTKAFAHC
jgi:arylsulfatase A-like enzyme